MTAAGHAQDVLGKRLRAEREFVRDERLLRITDLQVSALENPYAGFQAGGGCGGEQLLVGRAREPRRLDAHEGGRIHWRTGEGDAERGCQWDRRVEAGQHAEETLRKRARAGTGVNLQHYAGVSAWWQWVCCGAQQVQFWRRRQLWPMEA